jgi:ferredoxin
VHQGRAVMLQDRCIDCGECLKVCTRGAVVPLTDSMDDLSRFRYKVAIPSPTVFVQFDPEVLPGMVLQALRNSGFDDAVGLSQACAEVTAATEIFLSRYEGPYPLISSFCPAVVRLVQRVYPELVEQLLPLKAPREVAARQVKSRKERETGIPAERIAVVYVTPCSSKMVSIADHPGMTGSCLDAAVSIRDLFQLLAGATNRVAETQTCCQETETASGLWWSFLGGLPRFVPAERSISVAGLPNVIRILDNIEKGRLRGYAFIECHACPEGCVSGALTVENSYVARARAIRLMQELQEGVPVDRAEIQKRYDEDWYLWESPAGARPLEPLDHDISGAISKMKQKAHLKSELPGIDCGACGAPSCDAFAEDVVLGRAKENDCVFVRQKQIEETVERLHHLVRMQPGVTIHRRRTR